MPFQPDRKPTGTPDGAMGGPDRGTGDTPDDALGGPERKPASIPKPDGSVDPLESLPKGAKESVEKIREGAREHAKTALQKTLEMSGINQGLQERLKKLTEIAAKPPIMGNM